MNNKEKELFEGFLSKTLNLDAEAISGLYNTEGELIDITKVLEADASRVAKFKIEKQQQHDRGIKEGAEKIEKELKKKYSVESEFVGVELFDYVLENKTSDLNEKLLKKATKDEDFEKHPKYAQLKKDHETQLKVKEQEWESKLKEKESEWTKKETLSKVAKIAFSELDEGYILPENSQRASALKDVMQRELDSENYNFLDDGTPVILDKDGKPKEDAHGKLISFKDHVNGIAIKYFDKRIAQTRENSGNKNQQQPITGVYKTKDEFIEDARKAKTVDEQAAVAEKLKASNLN